MTLGSAAPAPAVARCRGRRPAAAAKEILDAADRCFAVGGERGHLGVTGGLQPDHAVIRDDSGLNEAARITIGYEAHKLSGKRPLYHRSLAPTYLESLFSLDGKIAVVLGGTSGIGRAIARGYAQAGATVIASSRDQAKVNAIADELEQEGRRTLRMTSDILDRASLERLREAAVIEFGRVDILVVTSGVPRSTDGRGARERMELGDRCERERHVLREPGLRTPR